ncbi:trypsin eta-like [Bactrocera neohumeralis]|uniref:trypsin eta-like n=1 Tax=Bactrocera neohumeralis TaxID=98809 RepID=UPI0021651C01|nr:trypsin eta-like [Bactrocera neohumeralis]
MSHTSISLIFIAFMIVDFGAAYDNTRLQLNQNRIIGGDDVSIVHYAHQVSLRRKTCQECAYLHLCGGNILNEDTILTAAHCVIDRDIRNFTVVAGTGQRTGGDGTVMLIEKIVTHERYNASITDYDVALLFLATPLTLDGVFTTMIQLVQSTPEIGAKATITGWGTLSEGGVAALQLQAANVFVRAQCSAAYGDRFTAAMLCAAAKDSGKDACQMDAGGPLLVENQLAGIISWAIGCARPESPGVYVNVSHVRQWIELTVAANSLYKF